MSKIRWRSTPQDLRHRKKVGITLSPAAIAALAELSTDLGLSKSTVVELLLIDHEIADVLRSRT